MAKMMGVGPAGRKSITPIDSGRMTKARRAGGMIAVKAPVTSMKDCHHC